MTALASAARELRLAELRAAVGTAHAALVAARLTYVDTDGPGERARYGAVQEAQRQHDEAKDALFRAEHAAFPVRQ